MTASVPIAQVIYTNVDAQHSPTNRRGDQVVFATHNMLDEQEINEVGNRLADFDTQLAVAGKPGALYREQFFRTTSRKPVVARSIPLAQTDQGGRGGLFFAHALILAREAFRQSCHNNPFVLLDGLAFYRSLADCHRQPGVQKGYLPPLDWSGKPTHVDPGATLTPMGPFDPATLWPLLLATVRCCRANEQQRKTLGVNGFPQEMGLMLRQLFHWLPLSFRLRCSFDTCSTGDRLAQMPYLLLGLPGNVRRRQASLCLFDQGSRSFSPALPSHSRSLFEEWLREQLKQGDPPTAQRLEDAFHLSVCLEKGQLHEDKLRSVDDDLFEDIAFSEAGMSALSNLLHSYLADQLPPALVPAAYQPLLGEVFQRKARMISLLTREAQSEDLIHWLYAHYSRVTRFPDNQQLSGLAHVLQANKPTQDQEQWFDLIMMYLFWSRHWDEIYHRLSARLHDPHTAGLYEQRYQRFVEWALPRMPGRLELEIFESALGPGMGPTFLCATPADREFCRGWLRALLGGRRQPEDGLVGQLESHQPAVPARCRTWLMDMLIHRTFRDEAEEDKVTRHKSERGA